MDHNIHTEIFSRLNEGFRKEWATAIVIEQCHLGVGEVFLDELGV